MVLLSLMQSPSDRTRTISRYFGLGFCMSVCLSPSLCILYRHITFLLAIILLDDWYICGILLSIVLRYFLRAGCVVVFFLWPVKWQNMVKVTTSTGEADQCSCESKPKAWWKCFHGREYFMKLAFDKYVVEVFVGSVCWKCL